MIEDWAEENGHTIVAWAEDVEVSGSVSPFNAPELGKFLTNEGSRSWDILVAWKLDRLARSSITLHQLFGWLQDNEKELVCISDNIDLSSWVGRMVAGVIAGVAEGELEAITERIQAGQKALRESGRFRGGTPPFGYKSVKRDGGRYLEKDEKTQNTLQAMIRLGLEGLTASEIARRLNAQGARTARGKEWNGGSVLDVLTNKNMLGWTMHQGQPVLNSDGTPVMKCEPSISMDNFSKLQALIEARSKRDIRPRETSAYLGVLRCWHCGKNLHIQRKRGINSPGSYRCQECNNTVPVRYIEPILEDIAREELFSIPIMEKAPGVSIQEGELEEAQQTYSDIASFLSTAPDQETRETLFEQLRVVGERIKRLEEQKKTPAGDQWIDTGQTYGGLWESLDTQERRRLLNKAGIFMRVRTIKKATRWEAPILETELVIPDELKNRLA
ncbi:hypothetical protein BJP06_06440 [Corynebacterium sp. NML120713]|nr:hypothetical protein BJP06_06440 [Corynebacterium sp. NML120713]